MVRRSGLAVLTCLSDIAEEGDCISRHGQEFGSCRDRRRRARVGWQRTQRRYSSGRAHRSPGLSALGGAIDLADRDAGFRLGTAIKDKPRVGQLLTR